VRANQQHPSLMARERDDHAVVASQMLHTQARERFVAREPVTERRATLTGQRLLEQVIRLAAGRTKPSNLAVGNRR